MIKIQKKEILKDLNEFIEKSILHSYMVLKDDVDKLFHNGLEIDFEIKIESCDDNYNDNVLNLLSKKISVTLREYNKKEKEKARILTNNLRLKFQMFNQYSEDIVRYCRVLSKEQCKIDLHFNLSEYINLSHQYSKKYEVDINKKNSHHIFKNINNPNGNYGILNEKYLKYRSDLINTFISKYGMNFDYIKNNNHYKLNKKEQDILDTVIYINEMNDSFVENISIASIREELKKHSRVQSEYFESGLKKALSLHERNLISQVISSENKNPQRIYNISKKRL